MRGGEQWLLLNFLPMGFYEFFTSSTAAIGILRYKKKVKYTGNIYTKFYYRFVSNSEVNTLGTIKIVFK